MAIAFNLPSEREATEENFSRLNRLLAELYEVLCHILVARQPIPEAQESRRDRPFSDSDLDRPTFSGLPDITPAPRRRPGSAINPPPLLNFEDDLDDDVFVSPRYDNGNDLFATRNMEIFGGRFGSPRTPAGVLLSPRRERRFTFSVSSEKHWRDKGGTVIDEADGVSLPSDTDEPDAPTPEPPPPSKDSTSSESSIFSSLMSDKVSGSIATAVLLVLGWKLLSNNR